MQRQTSDPRPEIRLGRGDSRHLSGFVVEFSQSSHLVADLATAAAQPVSSRLSGQDNLDLDLFPGGDVRPLHARLLVQLLAFALGELVKGGFVGPALDHHPFVRVLAVAVYPDVLGARLVDVLLVVAHDVDELIPVVAAGPEHNDHVSYPLRQAPVRSSSTTDSMWYVCGNMSTIAALLTR